MGMKRMNDLENVGVEGMESKLSVEKTWPGHMRPGHVHDPMPAEPLGSCGGRSQEEAILRTHGSGNSQCSKTGSRWNPPARTASQQEGSPVSRDSARL